MQAVNYGKALGYKHIVMVGLSGAGWTTTISAAIDPRTYSSTSAGLRQLRPQHAWLSTSQTRGVQLAPGVDPASAIAARLWSVRGRYHVVHADCWFDAEGPEQALPPFRPGHAELSWSGRRRRRLGAKCTACGGREFARASDSTVCKSLARPLLYTPKAYFTTTPLKRACRTLPAS